MKVDEARIATPCGADWRTMQPRGNARLCETCDKVVHDLSGRSEAEARALLRTRPNEGLCIRYLHDAEGNVWFGGDGPARLVPPSRLARGASLAAAATALLVAPLLIEACGGAAPDAQGYYDNTAAAGDGGPSDTFGTDADAAKSDSAADGDAATGDPAASDAGLGRREAHPILGGSEAGPDAQ